MQIDTTPLALVLDASWPVKIIILILILLSVISWAVIGRKLIQLMSVRAGDQVFDRLMSTAQSLSGIHKGATHLRGRGIGYRIFLAGYREFAQASSRVMPLPVALEGTDRTMQAMILRERGKLSAGLVFLASVASVSPYIGLLGTVIGIMNSFLALSSESQLTLAAVAPGIAEALIATAIGLFAAIPALLAYNRLHAGIDTMCDQYDQLVVEILSRMQHVAYPSRSSQAGDGL